MIDPASSLSPRLLAAAGAAFFAPVVATFALAPGAWWADYPGIAFHLALFLLVAKLEAPAWARAAGYGWLILDTMTGVLTLNGVPHAIADPVRLGGHVFAGIWIAVASLPGSPAVRVVGVSTGSWLALYTLLSPFLPRVMLAPASLLVLLWLGLIAWRNGNGAAASG